jgi:hypothetical protein
MEATPHRAGKSGFMRRSAVLAVFLFAAFALLPKGAPAAYQDPEKVADTRAALHEWVQVRKLISAEQRDWKLGKQLIEDRIKLFDRETASLQGRIAEMRESIDEAQGSERELSVENGALKASSLALRERVTGLEARVSELLAGMPKQVQDLVQPLSQSIPKDPENTDTALSVRYRNIVGILNLINKFNRELHLKSEKRQLANGSTAEVSVLYFGVGQAFFVTADGTSAGIGTSGPEGWTWIPADEHAPAIARAIAIYNNEEPAAFVQLPVQIQ